jgi:hypothetical protein
VQSIVDTVHPEITSQLWNTPSQINVAPLHASRPSVSRHDQPALLTPQAKSP